MLLDLAKFVSEKTPFTNHKIGAMKYPECPINETCAHVFIGTGNLFKKCRHYQDEGFQASCSLMEEKLNG